MTAARRDYYDLPIETICERYRNGASLRHLARQYDATYGKIHRVLAARGVKMRSHGGKPIKRRSHELPPGELDRLRQQVGR